MIFQDGFYDGELLDGRRGLVPSNFIQKLVGDDLLEFHQSVIQGLRDCDDCASTNIPQDFDYHQLNTGQLNFQVVYIEYIIKYYFNYFFDKFNVAKKLAVFIM